MISPASWFAAQFASQLIGPVGVLLVICLQVALLAGLSQLLSSRIKQAAIGHRLWLSSVVLVLALLPLHLFFGGWPVVITSETQKVSSTIHTQPTAPQLNDTSFTSPDDTIEPIAAQTNPVIGAATTINPTNDKSTHRSTLPTINMQQWAVAALLMVYLSIASWLAWRTALATARLTRSAHAAQPPGERITRLLQELAEELELKRLPSIGLTEHVSMPLVFGFFKPTILLPIGFTAWDADGQRAVLAHELAHVARRDAWGQLLSRIMCCLYWFHPASWWIERRLSETRELATDQRALTTGLSAQEYAHALVNVLKQLHGSNTPSLALPIAAATPLRERISYLLASTTQESASGRWLGVALITVLVAITGLSCVRLVTSILVDNPLQAGPLSTEPLTPDDPQQTTNRRPEDNDLFVRMCECEVSTVAAEKAGAKVTITGRVVSSGQAAAGATVVFRESSQIYLSSDREGKYFGDVEGNWMPTPDVLARTTTGADGRFEFKSITVTKKRPVDAWRGDVVAIHPQSGLAWMDFVIKENVDLTKEDVSLELEPLTDITGTVLSPQQEPVADAEVRIHRFQLGPKPRPNPSSSFTLETLSSQLTVSTRTDGSGRFIFKNIPRDMVAQLTAHHADYLPNMAAVTMLDREQIPPGSLPKEYFRDIQASPCRIVLNKGIIVTGQIVDKISRRPVPEVSVVLEQFAFNKKSDLAGKFKLHLPPLNMPLDPRDRSTPHRPSGHILRIEPSKNSGYLELLYRYNPDEISRDKPLDIGLERGVRVRGKVVADDGQPIQKATVRVWNFRGDGVTHQTATNDEGTFELLVPQGKLELAVGGGSHGYQLPLSQALYYSAEEADTTGWPLVSVDTSDGKPLSISNIVVRRVAPIQCQVTFADGTPAANASVVIKDNPRRPLQGIQWGLLSDISNVEKTDAQGRVALRSRLPTENATVFAKLTINKEIYQTRVALKDARDAGGLVKIVIDKIPLLTGRVLSSGQPVQGAVVRIGDSPLSKHQPFDASQIETLTNERGEFQTQVLPGEYVVTVIRVPAYAGKFEGPKDVTLAAKGKYEAGDLEVNLPLQPLTGRLINAAGQPVANAQVRPLSLNPNAPFIPEGQGLAVTDANGNFQFPALLQGEYDLHIRLQQGQGKTLHGINQRLRPGNSRVDVMINDK